MADEYEVKIPGTLVFKVIASDEDHALDDAYENLYNFKQKNFFEFFRNEECCSIELIREKVYLNDEFDDFLWEN